MKPTIEVGNLVLPYTRTLPIITYRQDDSEADEFFIRAKKHVGLNVWYADCAEVTGNGTHPISSKSGLIVFVPRIVKKGEIIRITSVFPNGAAARGSMIPAPQDFRTPLDFELGNVGL